jgi:predicted dinucleotide-binding enzyme
MTTWGFIGSGNIGATVAQLAVAAGHDVVLSNSRGPETLADLVDDLGPHARAATPAEAARAGDDLEAKKIVSERLEEIGYDSVDLGPLSEGWRTQPDTAAYGVMYAVDPQAWDQGARPAPEVEVAARAAPSRRQRPGMSRP